MTPPPAFWKVRRRGLQTRTSGAGTSPFPEPRTPSLTFFLSGSSSGSPKLLESQPQIFLSNLTSGPELLPLECRDPHQQAFPHTKIRGSRALPQLPQTPAPSSIKTQDSSGNTSLPQFPRQDLRLLPRTSSQFHPLPQRPPWDAPHPVQSRRGFFCFC